MSETLGRRGFLSAGIAAAISAQLAATHNEARAIEPIERNGQAKFKYSLAAYSYRGLLQGKAAELTMHDFVSDCARMGLEGTELTSYYFPADVTPEYLRDLKRHCFRLGLDVSGTAVGNDFGHADPQKLREQIEHVKHWVDNAAILGAPVIRIFAGHVPKGGSADDTHRQMVAAIDECCEYAGQHGVHLALENHGGPTATAEGLLRFVHDVKSPWFGVNLDGGNFHTEDVYGDLAKVAPYALNVQVKVVISGPDKQKQPTDYARLAKILRDANYRGYIVLEYEESGDPRQECPKFLDEIRTAFEASA
ncbi:MAG: sugar phosphate isomerase/epimerase family protein [Pirellulaceae bacterium]